jgi:hypothetical protein
VSKCSTDIYQVQQCEIEADREQCMLPNFFFIVLMPSYSSIIGLVPNAPISDREFISLP